MRYLIYTETFPSRLANDIRQTGIGRYCADIASGLASLGHDVLVATNTDVGVEPYREPFPVQIIGPAPRRPLELVRRATRLRRLVAAERPDIVLVGDPLAHRVVASVVGAVAAPYCPIFYGTELAAWIASRQRTLGALRQAWIGWYLRRSEATVCISRFTQSLLRKLAAGKPRECIVHPCVSELCVTLPERPEVSKKLRRQVARGGSPPLILLTVARISERKNQLGVLQALAQLHASSAVRFHYLVVGNVDSEAHRPYLQRLLTFAESNGLTDWLTIVENTTDEEKVRYLDACDVFIMLSRTVGSSVEGFGISVIEAAARGKPVVVSQEGGMPETLLDGATGLTVAPEDTPGVVRALADLAGDPGRRGKMGSAGREYTRRHFTPRASAAGLHDQLFQQGNGSAAASAVAWNPIATPGTEDS